MSQIAAFFRSPKRIFFFLVKAGFIGFIFALIFIPEKIGVNPKYWAGLNFSDLLDALERMDARTAAGWLLFASVVKMLGILCGIVRWKLLLNAQGIRLPFIYLARCWFMGRMIGLFLPGTVGLDGYRLVESAAYTGQVVRCATVIAIEKLIGFIALFLLVFLTLPLGARLFTFNPVMLAAVLVILGTFILTAFLLLLNPRVVQVLVQVVPTPSRIRNQVNRLGAAVTAYAGHRRTLGLAVLLGLGVHLGICLMYFGTAMAVSGGKSNFLDVLFASPLIIVGSVIAPTVSGAGVREGVMTALLGGKYGDAEAFLFGHIGLWIGEGVPFLLSVPLLLFGRRPAREEFLSDLEKVRLETARSEEDLHLAPDVVADYRTKLIAAFGGGALAGLVGGALFGLAEASWHVANLGTLTDTAAYWWGPLVYGVVGAPIGFGVAAVLVFVYLLFNRFASPNFTVAVSMGGTVALMGLPVGVFRYRRDILQEAAMHGPDYIKVFAGVAVAALVLGILGFAIARILPRGIVVRTGAALAGFALVVFGGMAYGSTRPINDEPPAFTATGITGPNILFVAVDTLRADFLPVYRANARATTPNVASLAQDSVVFQNAIAQSSWTKASFGTMFSGLYPEAHNATGKVSKLPLDVTTLAEVLNGGGYYTRGFSNNPNITSAFDYNQGFVEYTDLKPDLLFGARPSCEKLVGYDILRKIYQTISGRLFRGRINITDFYQPADRITDVGLAWLDSPQRPQDAPFYLFLHYMDPHDPYRDPERPGKGYARVQMVNPDPEEYKEAFIRSYVFEIEYMDTHLGRLINGLKQRGLYDDTLIVFTADHGEEFHEHGGWWHGLSLYDEQIKIPLMLKLPGNAGKGTYINDLARHVDLAPTLAQFAHLQPAAKWQGQPLLTEQLASNNANIDFVHSHLDFEGIRLKSLRGFNRKFIEANEGNKRGYAPEEVYDLIADPGEQHNLAGDMAVGDLELLKELLTNMSREIEAGAVAGQTTSLDEMSPAERERMKALGYLGDDETED